uniref:restriction endonuclease n=1 Tax=Segatella hominis TaxID=2518605 RepID=UPI00402A397C
MRILIEEYQYNVSEVHDALYGIDAMENIEGKVSIHYVGYYYNALLDDCVFILPKVLLRDVDGKELAFGKYLPNEIINPEGQANLTKEERDFIYGFAVWIYRAIVVYKNDKNNDSTIVYQKKINQVGGGNKRKSNTFLDILLSLIQFNKDNKSFFFFVLKNIHSGNNKINWMRTISTTSAIIQEDNAIYLNPVNKKRQINFDEELLVIFFSILNYIGDTYGFPKEINCNFDLITGKRFEKYRNGYGIIRLNQIKYKYFSDKALQLWKLCYAFFDKSRQIYVNTSQKEYLLVKSFHIVFEAIIDALVGDSPLPDGMDKKQEDGKIVDHLFTAKSLIEGESSNTYYIGDSKYYKMGNELGKESVYKQYTYARNVIQWNLDIFNDGKVPPSGIKLRDDETEGYNIIPNFFISASMDEKYRYSIDGIKETDRKNNRYMSKQFQNRLFDRDTLLLFHYDVNFLFVLSLYARNNKDEQYHWKENIRSKFCTEIRNWLQQDFDFYAMRPLPTVNVKEYVETHFRQVLGKVYTPFSEENIFSLALDKKEEKDNEALLAELRKSFIVKECSLGTDPHDVLPEERVYEYVKDAIPQKELVYRAENVFVLAVDRDSYDDYEHNRLSVEIPLDINNGMFKIDSIDYFMFIVENASEGYYRVANSRLKIKDGKLILALSLTDYQSFEFGFKEVAECDTKTIVSLQDLMNVR